MRNKMLKTLVSYPDIVSLTPNSGVQFLDFGLNADAVARVKREFWPEPVAGDAAKVVLHPVAEDDSGQLSVSSGAKRGQPAPEDECYAQNAVRALAAFDGVWLPIPFFRRRASGGYEVGPTTWARGRLVAAPDPNRGLTHRLTIAFDTLLTPRDADGPYAAPEEPRDSTEDVFFGFATDEDAISRFIGAPWIEDWLKTAYASGLSRQRQRSVAPEDFGNPGEQWAAYWVLLDALAAAVEFPQVRLIDIYTDRGGRHAVDVNLVVDIGNSRTAGVFIEERPDRALTDLSDIARLELRNLSAPEQASADPFESRVEFYAARFGEARRVREAGRRVQREPFIWPSPVRIGPEATMLAAGSSGVDGATGMSSPKRYLWDDEERERPWRNNRGGEAEAPAIRGPVVARLTSRGERVNERRGEMAGLKPGYSRSALYTLMLVELISHALSQVNSVGYRRRFADSDSPRRLARIVLTLPSATPVAEQKIMKRRARDAVELVWKAMGWADDDPLYPKPAILLDWDEATVTHLVYLYNEINQRFRRQAADVFTSLGRGRVGREGKPALRIASIDIGGGTTDLMVIEHEAVGSAVIAPRQLFREGFRVAGDDLLKRVIEAVLLPAVGAALSQAGAGDGGRIVGALFGGNVEGIDQTGRAERGRCVSQALAPAAIGLLQLYETMGDRDRDASEIRTLGELAALTGRDVSVAATYVDAEAARRGAAGFRLLDAPAPVVPAQLSAEIGGVFAGMLGDLCDVVRSYGCDYLLLTGRPSRLPAIKDIVLGATPTTPDRVVAMGEYRVASWYPFRASDGLIDDPKTTAVVGAMLAQITRRGVEQFRFQSDEIKMRSTARIFGAMEKDDLILDKRVCGQNVDLDHPGGLEMALEMETEFFLGFRQLPLERWTASPLYRLYFRGTEQQQDRIVLPVQVKLVRQDGREDDEAQMEQFKILEAFDREGSDVSRRIALRLQTLRVDRDLEAGYWLDSGVLNTDTLR